jgi:curved DNA-binding protein CbpA
MNYFANCQTVEEVKATYRKLAREHHPDLGGDAEVMKTVNNQYEQALKACDGQESVGSDKKTHTYRYDQEVEAEIMEIIQKLIAIVADSKVEIILIGRWIWITGETKPLKEDFKELGCKWHRDRSCWFWRSASDRGYGKGGDLDDLASKYGCQDFSTKAKSRKKALKKA